jgi:hypothetical protein
MAVIAALWTQVDYRSKQMAPWHAMSKGPQSADNSLLLDYVSPFFLESLYSSFRRSHWAVAAAIIGTILVKLLYIISTALFVLQSLPVVHHVGLSSMDQFSGEQFSLTAVDDSAAMDWAGTLMDGLEYPLGTSSQYAIQSFKSLSPIPRKSSLSWFRLKLALKIVLYANRNM